MTDNNEYSFLNYLRDQFRDPPNAMFTREMIANAQRLNHDQPLQNVPPQPSGGWAEAANPHQRHQNYEFIYCPQVPLTQTPVVLDPNSFNPREGLIHRYSQSRLREGAIHYVSMVIMGGVDSDESIRRISFDPPVKVNWAKDGF